MKQHFFEQWREQHILRCAVCNALHHSVTEIDCHNRLAVTVRWSPDGGETWQRERLECRGWYEFAKYRRARTA